MRLGGASRWLVRLLPALLLPVVAGCFRTGAPPSRESLECEVMLSISRELIADADSANHHKVIFEIGDQHEIAGLAGAPPLDREHWVSGAAQAEPPDPELLKRLWHQHSKGYRPCDAWFALLRTTGSGFGEAEVDAMVSRSRKANRDFDAAYEKYVATLSRPVIAADGKSAVIEESGVSAPLGGGGSVSLWRRDYFGRWRRKASRDLWIS